MLLRSPLFPRFPTAILRLCGNSGSSASYLPSTISVLSRCHIHFGAIAFAAPWAQNAGGRKVAKKVEAVKKEQTPQKKKDTVAEVKPPSMGTQIKHSYDRFRSNYDGEEDPVRKRGKQIQMICLLSMVWVPLEWGLEKFLKYLADSAIPADAQQVDFETFVQKYLRMGKIQKITLVVFNEKAVGTLRSGTIVDGKPAGSDHIVVNYAQSKLKSGFKAEVRLVELEIDIPLSRGVPIEEFNPYRNWKLALEYSGYAVAAFCVGMQFGTKLGRQAMAMWLKEIRNKVMTSGSL